jgi:ketoreductase RED2
MTREFPDLEGKVAIVTGSSSGIGEATARHLSLAGSSLVVNSATSVEAGNNVASSLPTDSIYVQADISDPNGCESVIDAAIGRFGRLDILVNNAGWTSPVDPADLEGLTDDIFKRTFEVNVFGTWSMSKMAIPHLRRSSDGNIVNITSAAGLRPAGSSIAYSMSKAALNHMTLLLAKTFGPIRVNAVAPGLVSTPWTADWADVRDSVRKRAPLGRVGTPDEIAMAVMSLVAATYVTGEVMVVDGGLTQVI